MTRGPAYLQYYKQLGIDPGSTTVELSATVETPVGEFAHCVYCLLCFDVLGITDGAGRAVTFSAWH